MVFPPLWYFLLFFVSFFGVTSWYLRNYTQKEDLLRLTSTLGIISMLTLLFWTLGMEV